MDEILKQFILSPIHFTKESKLSKKEIELIKASISILQKGNKHIQLHPY